MITYGLEEVFAFVFSIRTFDFPSYRSTQRTNDYDCIK